MSDRLWNFAIQAYARSGVEPLCLELQAAGLDVCLLLCGAWLGNRGVGCDAARARALHELAEPWREDVVKPLRRLRQDWRKMAAQDRELAALRERLKALELDAERELLARLERASQNWPEGGQDDTSAWLNALGGPQAAQCEESLLRLRQALEGDQA